MCSTHPQKHICWGITQTKYFFINSLYVRVIENINLDLYIYDAEKKNMVTFKQIIVKCSACVCKLLNGSSHICSV